MSGTGAAGKSRSTRTASSWGCSNRPASSVDSSLPGSWSQPESPSSGASAVGPTSPEAPAAPRVNRLASVALSLGALAVAASFVFPWLAELDAQRAIGLWEQHPRRAFASLDRARRLNPLSTRPDILAGVIAGRLNELPRMRLAFSRAVGRDSRFWYAHFELGLAEAALGHRA